jgi:hypothetical protein
LGEDDFIGGDDGVGDDYARGGEVEWGIDREMVYLAASEGGDVSTPVSR